MKSKTQIPKIGFAVLAGCAICLSAAAEPKQQVSRPYKITGVTVGEITAVTVTTNDLLISFNLVNVGEATHCGRYLNVGTTTLSLVTHTGTAEGTFSAANGDIIYWVGVIKGTALTVTATGGTGRFAGGSGGFVAELSNVIIDPLPPVVGGIISYTFEGTGRVSY